MSMQPRQAEQTPRLPSKPSRSLPPTYLAHLHRLLHQWLAHQVLPPDEGLPGPSNRALPPKPVWSLERLSQVELTVWQDVILSGHQSDNAQGLLRCEWEEWILSSAKRKAAWKDGEGNTASGKGKGKERATSSTEPADVTSKELTRNTIFAALASATSTPSRSSTRPSSSASSVRPGEQEDDASRGVAASSEAEQVPKGDEEGDVLRRWCELVRSMSGYVPLEEGYRDEWEVLDDEVPVQTPTQEFPGAFPQSGSAHYFHSHSPSLPRPKKPRTPLHRPPNDTAGRTDPPVFLKPVICLSFQPAQPSYNTSSVRSQSTVRFSRESSAGPEPSASSLERRRRSGSAPRGDGDSEAAGSGLAGFGAWFTGNKWSEMTAAPELQDISMDFVPGRFALPLERSSSALARRSVSSLRISADQDADEADDNDDAGSSWSGTQRATSRRIKPEPVENVVIAGEELDMSKEMVQDGNVELVGGTIVVRGMHGEERRAIERVLRVLLYTIQSQILELALLQAFRIPREPDPPPLPSKPSKPETKRSLTHEPSSPVTATSPNTSLGRSKSWKHKGERKGLLAKLGLGGADAGSKGRGVWDGLIGRRRISASGAVASPGQNAVTDSDLPDDAAHHSSGFAALGLPRAVSTASSTAPSPSAPGTALQPSASLHGIERHLQTLSKLREMAHSTTPNLTFPLPPILLRIEEEDRLRREKALEELRLETGRQTASAGISDAPLLPPKNDYLPGSATPVRSVSAASTPYTGSPLPNTAEVDPGLWRGRAAAYRLGGDVRAGVGSLAGELDGWRGWLRLQRLEYLSWTGVEIEEGGKGEDAAGNQERTAVAVTLAEVPEEKATAALPSEGALSESTPAASQVDHASEVGTIGKEEVGDQGSSAIPDSERPSTPPVSHSRDPSEHHGASFTRKIIACTKPTLSAHRFYDPSSDASIRDHLLTLSGDLGLIESGESGAVVDADGTISAEKFGGEEQSKPRRKSNETDASAWEAVCPRSGCSVAEREHIQTWVSGEMKIFGRMRASSLKGRATSSKSDTPRSKTDGDAGDMAVSVSVQCGACAKTAEATMLGKAAGEVSWNKFLELIMHTTHLVPPSLCPHAPAIPSSHGSSLPSSSARNGDTDADWIYTFHTPAMTLALQSQRAAVLNTRLPKMQVGPNVAKRKLGAEAARVAFDAVGRKVEGEEGKIKLREEIEEWAVTAKRDLTESNVGPDGEDSASTAENSGGEPASGGSAVSATLERSLTGLLKELEDVSSSELNDIRRSFRRIFEDHTKALDAAAKDRRLSIGMAKRGRAGVPECIAPPQLFLPGGSVPIRENEPASVIAYTLSSLAYFDELCHAESRSSAESGEATVHDKSENIESRDSTKEGEIWTTEVRRKDTPRDLLPLRTITKKRSEATLPSARLPLTVAPNQPSLELNLEPVTGRSQAGDRMEQLVKNISRATAQDPNLTTSSATGTATTASLSVTSLPIAGPASFSSTTLTPPMSMSASSTSLSQSQSETESIEAPQPRFALKGRRRLTDDMAAPPSSFRRVVSANTTSSPRMSPAPFTPSASPDGTPSRLSVRGKENRSITPASTIRDHPSSAKEGWGSVTSTFSSSFNTILKFGSDVTDSLASRVRSTDSRSLALFMAPLGFSADSSMAAGQRPTDDRPHIQFTYTLPEKKRISCTVYYAAAFDTLRRRCAVDRSFIRSLERTEGWAADGGKSKATFWKTTDGRLIVKELVSKWNVSDMQALLEVAPAYFEHMANTHNKATSLAKIVGFYSVKIHDLKSNEKQSMDLLVMENLFWRQNIDRTFDLKGIEGRRVPKGREGGSTLFDGEWLDLQTNSPVLIHPHAKKILLDSLTFDTHFLSAQSIMDYSLLLGFDESNAELVVGLVDAVGSYGLFKNIESMGKMALKRGREGDVTIIPPEQYRERFENALRQYFIACPDKWSRTTKRGACANANLEVDLPAIM